MRLLMPIADRVLVIFAAYVTASVTAALTLSLIFILAGRGPFVSIMFLGPTFGSIIVMCYAFLPALLVIAYAEQASKRSALFYAATGTLAGVISAGFFFFVSMSRSAGSAAGTIQTTTLKTLIEAAAFAAWVSAGGLAGGLVYWRLAGRKAGEWRRPLVVDTSY